MGDDFAAVLAAAQRRSEDAFAVLWRDAHPALLRYLRMLSPDGAEDIAAETWVQIVRGLPKFTGDEAAWRAWLFTTARRRLYDASRHRTRHPADPLDDVGTGELPQAPGADQLALENLATESAIALVGKLPEKQAEVIMLRVVAGMDTEAVAAALGMSTGAVRVTAHRGLRKLESLLSQAGTTSRAVV